MPHLRPTALAGLLLALVSAVTLTGCGFHYPTDRVNTIAGGVNDRTGDVDALGIRILATAKGEGRLIGSLSNNLREEASLDALSSERAAAVFEPVVVAGRGIVNLSHDVFIPVTGDFTAGQFVPLELSFSDGTTLSLDVPVVKPCFQYSDVPTEAATGKPADGRSSHSSEGEAAGAAASEEAHAEDEHADDHAEGGDATFTCADAIPTPGGGGH